MLNVAIVGCGGMGGGHAVAIATGSGHAVWRVKDEEGVNKMIQNATDISKKLALAGTYDINPERQKWAADLGYHVYNSYDEILADPKVDIVLIATPNDCHCDQAIAAMRAGKHVLCEKPVTLSSEELLKVMAVAEETSKVFYPRQNRRWDRDFLIIKEIYDKQLLGNVFNIECRVMGSRGIPGDWRGKKAQGGGMMLDWGVHLLDRLVTMVPEKITHVFCTLSNITNDEVDDGLKMHLTFESGLTMAIEVATCHFINLPLWYIAGVNGTASIADWSCNGEMIRVLDWENKDTTPILAGEGLTKTMAPRTEDSIQRFTLPEVEYDFNALYSNLVDTINGTAEQIITNEQALRVLRLMEAAFESAEKREVVAFE